MLDDTNLRPKQTCLCSYYHYQNIIIIIITIIIIVIIIIIIMDDDDNETYIMGEVKGNFSFSHTRGTAAAVFFRKCKGYIQSNSIM